MGADEKHSELTAELREEIGRFRQSQVQSLQAQGKVVGCLGSMVPLELVRACGCRAVRLLEAGSAQDFEAAAELMGADTCPFCRCQIGRRLGGRSPQAELQVLVAANHCDQSRRSGQVFGQHFNVPLLPIMVPATWEDQSSLEMYVSELRWLGEELAQITGTFPSQSRLEESITAYGAARRAVGGLLEQLGNTPVLAHELVCLLGVADPVSLVGFVAQVRGQVARLASGESVAGDRPTVLVVGSIMGDEDISLLKALEGRCRVVQATCSGRMFVDLQVELKGGDAIEGLGRAYWEQLPSVRSRPNSPFYHYVNEMIQRYKVDAIVYRSLKFCDLWSLEAVRFKQEISLPVLALDCTYGPGQASLVDGRVQALLEMVEEARR